MPPVAKPQNPGTDKKPRRKKRKPYVFEFYVKRTFNANLY